MPEAISVAPEQTIVWLQGQLAKEREAHGKVCVEFRTQVKGLLTDLADAEDRYRSERARADLAELRVAALRDRLNGDDSDLQRKRRDRG